MTDEQVQQKSKKVSFKSTASRDAREKAAAMAMSTVIVIENENLVGPDLRWPLRIAKRGRSSITLLVCVPKNIANSRKNIDLSSSTEQSEYEKRIAERMVSTLDEYLGLEQWTNERSGAHGEAEDAGTNSRGRPMFTQLRLLEPRHLMEEIRRLTPHPQADLVLFVGSREPDGRKEFFLSLKEALSSIACSMGVIVPGVQQDKGELLVAADRGPQARNAIHLAAALAAETDRRLNGLYVEPDIGPDAEDVGRRILDRLLKSALEEKVPSDVTRRVVIDNDPAKGIIETCRQESFELIVLGATRLGALGEIQSKGIPNRVLQARPNATLIAVRRTVPFQNRLQRWAQSQVQRFVPQLARAGRIELVERVQSNSHWNFDFMLLIALSTLIATLGLLDDSPAVIIGAMLVAPLMTPLIGLGLAIVQANIRLAKMTLKAAFFGFVTVFCIAYVTGLLVGDFQEATAEMEARDWPQMLDLIVAFVSGLAAAYASSRPGLLAALPGVAIAAALVPPVATSGLATAIGDYDLAIGAMLLFDVNIIAIIAAAAVSFRLVGIRHAGKADGQTRPLARILVIAAITMSLLLAIVPPLLQAPAELVQAVEDVLAEEHRLRRIRLNRELGTTNVQMDIGGSSLPDARLKQRLGELARKHIGENAGVRLTFRYETLVK
jgi:uncharacterized hydrophobic protein (TIGR00271 family)